MTNLDKYKTIQIEITYGVLRISGERNGKWFMTKRTYGGAHDVVMYVRKVWESTGIWPTVCLADEVRATWSAFLTSVHRMMDEYRASVM